MPPNESPTQDVRRECDLLVSLVSTLLRQFDAKELDLAEASAESLVAQALRVRRAVITNNLKDSK